MAAVGRGYELLLGDIWVTKVRNPKRIRLSKSRKYKRIDGLDNTCIDRSPGGKRRLALK
jgi:hypothetical protein